MTTRAVLAMRRQAAEKDIQLAAGRLAERLDLQEEETVRVKRPQVQALYDLEAQASLLKRVDRHVHDLVKENEELRAKLKEAGVDADEGDGEQDKGAPEAKANGDTADGKDKAVSPRK